MGSRRSALHAESRFMVRCYNEISDFTGNSNHVCQRGLHIAPAGEDQAIALAISRFQQLEGTTNWTACARTIECVLMALMVDVIGVVEAACWADSHRL